MASDGFTMTQCNIDKDTPSCHSCFSFIFGSRFVHFGQQNASGVWLQVPQGESLGGLKYPVMERGCVCTGVAKEKTSYCVGL